MMTMYAKFQLSSFETVGEILDGGQTDNMVLPNWQKSTILKILSEQQIR